jgi:hypothetical protein
MMFRRIAPAVFAAAALAALAPAAMANTTATGYGGPGGNQQHHVTKPKILGVTTSGGGCSSSGTSGTSGSGSNCSGTAPTCVSGGSGNSGSGSGSGCTENASSGSLPFTGFDLILVAGAGIALLGAGFGLRRLTHRESTA